MNRLQKINLAYLKKEYFDEVSGAQYAVYLFDRIKKGKSRRNLYNLLRHHDEWEISEQETWERDGFDYLLGYYSLIEIACITNFVPRTLPQWFKRGALSHLSHPAVRQYYEVHYPLLLPILLRHQLHGDYKLKVPVDDNAQSLYPLFLEISLPIERDKRLETFLWFLDGGSRDGYDIEDTAKTLGNRHAFLTSMGKTIEDDENENEENEDAEYDELDLSVQGFVEFLRFCRRFDGLLKAADEYPLLQSAFWHYHAYWFDHLDEMLGRELKRCIEQFEKWGSKSSLASSADSRRSLKEARLSREEMVAIIKRLTSGRYKWPLYESMP